MKDDTLCPATSYEANIGDSIALCCPVSGNPPPEVEWTFGDVKVKESLDTNLVIIAVKESNYGSYNCTARSLEKVAGPFSITLNKMQCKLLVIIIVIIIMMMMMMILITLVKCLMYLALLC